MSDTKQSCNAGVWWLSGHQEPCNSCDALFVALQHGETIRQAPEDSDVEQVDLRQLYRHAFLGSLPALVQEVHERQTGSSDVMAQDVYRRMLCWLRWRDDNWTEPTSPYDECIRSSLWVVIQHDKEHGHEDCGELRLGDHEV